MRPSNGQYEKARTNCGHNTCIVCQCIVFVFISSNGSLREHLCHVLYEVEMVESKNAFIECDEHSPESPNMKIVLYSYRISFNQRFERFQRHPLSH